MHIIVCNVYDYEIFWNKNNAIEKQFIYLMLSKQFHHFKPANSRPIKLNNGSTSAFPFNTWTT